MANEGLPFGSGVWEVWGVEATERDDNRGLRSTQQDVSKQSAPVYRTDDENEARKLVQEGGFARDGRFFATTHVVNTAAEQHKQNVAEQTGVHVRQGPKPTNVPIRKEDM